MAVWRQVVELALSDEDIAALAAISRSRTEPASRVERARMLLSYRKDSSFFAVGRTMGVHHQTVQRCVERALAYGPMAALEDLPRPGKQPTITAEAKAWVVNLACRKAKELGYPHELWTTRLLARHARENAPAARQESASFIRALLSAWTPLDDCCVEPGSRHSVPVMAALGVRRRLTLSRRIHCSAPTVAG